MPETADKIRQIVQERFARIAQAPVQEKAFPGGPASAKKLGYDFHEIDALPAAVTASFCGVGNLPAGLRHSIKAKTPVVMLLLLLK